MPSGGHNRLVSGLCPAVDVFWLRWWWWWFKIKSLCFKLWIEFKNLQNISFRFLFCRKYTKFCKTTLYRTYFYYLVMIDRVVFVSHLPRTKEAWFIVSISCCYICDKIILKVIILFISWSYCLCAYASWSRADYTLPYSVLLNSFIVNKFLLYNKNCVCVKVVNV